MSHAGIWRAACSITIYFPWIHFDTHSVARGVTDPGVGSGVLFGAGWNPDVEKIQKGEERPSRKSCFAQ
jgi:hypothetical protein